jgi:hypothetical protein
MSAVSRRDVTMALDGFELGCDNCEKVRVAFALDCCDREAISFVATTEGINGEDVRDLMTVAVEARFGPVNRLPAVIEWLTDNGSGYIAGETRRFAREIGFEPLTAPVQSPQSYGVAKVFVRTIKSIPPGSIRCRTPKSSCFSQHGSITTTDLTRTRTLGSVHRESSSQTVQSRRTCPIFEGKQHPTTTPGDGVRQLARASPLRHHTSSGWRYHRCRSSQEIPLRAQTLCNAIAVTSGNRFSGQRKLLSILVLSLTHSNPPITASPGQRKLQHIPG